MFFALNKQNKRSKYQPIYYRLWLHSKIWYIHFIFSTSTHSTNTPGVKNSTVNIVFPILPVAELANLYFPNRNVKKNKHKNNVALKENKKKIH